MDAELSRIASLPQKDRVRPSQSPRSPTSSPPLAPLTLLVRAAQHAQQTSAYLSLLSSTLSSASPATLESDLALWLGTVSAPDFPQIVARQALDGFVAQLAEVEDKETRKKVLKGALEQLQPRLTSFEEQVRRRKASVLEECCHESC